MKFYKSSLSINNTKTIEEKLTFKDLIYYVDSIEDVNVICKIRKISEELIHLNFNISGDIKLKCCVTNKPVDYKLDINEELDISEDINNLDAEYIEGNEVILDQLILDLIYANIPSKVYAEGVDEKTRYKGSGFEFLSESEFRKEQEENKESSIRIVEKKNKK